MALVEVKPSRIDTAIADKIADHTNSGIEHTAQTLTWAADEHVLLALAAAGWLYTHIWQPQQRPRCKSRSGRVAGDCRPPACPEIRIRSDQARSADHTRTPTWQYPSQDRRATPSRPVTRSIWAHLPRRRACCRRRRVGCVRTVAVALSLTRIAVLAHWASDVVAGFALGAAVERLLRPWTLTQSLRKQLTWRKRP